MQNPKEDEQHLPNQPAQERTTYPSGMERERRMPTGGPGKPKPSPDHRPEEANAEDERRAK